MDWKEYENITKYIYETLGAKAGVKIIGHGNSCKVKGKSGIYHQIDVLTSHSDRTLNYKTAIECKFWKKKINKDVVMKVAGVIEDCGINKGVIVSKKGFTKDGISFAKYKNIGLVQLKEIEQRRLNENENVSDINLGILSLNTKTELRRPEILSADFDFIDRNLKLKKMKPSLMIVRLKDGKEVLFDHYLTSFKEKLHEGEVDKKVQKYYELKDAILINRTNYETAQIQGFTLEGKLTVRNTNSTLQLEIVDKVWMIMKSLFENNSFTILKSGIIKKDNT